MVSNGLILSLIIKKTFYLDLKLYRLCGWWVQLKNFLNESFINFNVKNGILNELKVKYVKQMKISIYK